MTAPPGKWGITIIGELGLENKQKNFDGISNHSLLKPSFNLPYLLKDKQGTHKSNINHWCLITLEKHWKQNPGIACHLDCHLCQGAHTVHTWKTLKRPSCGKIVLHLNCHSLSHGCHPINFQALPLLTPLRPAFPPESREEGVMFNVLGGPGTVFIYLTNLLSSSSQFEGVRTSRKPKQITWWSNYKSGKLLNISPLY